MPDNPIDITGSWSGFYWYDSSIAGQNPTAFVATFQMEPGSSQISGTVTDLGSVRVATAVGQIDGDAISFVKTYVSGANAHGTPITYTGRISEDGNMIEGAWMLEQKLLFLIPVRTTGVWQITRDQPLPGAEPNQATTEDIRII